MTFDKWSNTHPNQNVEYINYSPSFPHVPCQLISASLKTTAVLVSIIILCLLKNTDDWNTITFTSLCLPAFHLVVLQQFTLVSCVNNLLILFVKIFH